MNWSQLGTQFCLELCFGVLVALAFVPKAPVGRFFYRLMGTTALVPLLTALYLQLRLEDADWLDPTIGAMLLALVGYPFFSSQYRGRRWMLGLALSLSGCALALVFVITSSWTDASAAQIALGSLSAMATGAVAGSVGLAMVLGHWYLTVPKLEISHLERLNRVTVFAMLASLALVAVTCLVFAETLNSGRTPLLGPWGLFSLGSRVFVGLLLPLLFAWMTAGSLKFRNTRSATGILYASTILVLIGTAIAISLQDTYGIPL